MMDRMEREYGDNPEIQRSLQNLRSTFSPGRVGTLLGKAAEEYFKNSVYDPMSQLESSLMQRLDEIELMKKLYGMRKEEVPPEYKRLVDKYFESIAK